MVVVMVVFQDFHRDHLYTRLLETQNIHDLIVLIDWKTEIIQYYLPKKLQYEVNLLYEIEQAENIIKINSNIKPNKLSHIFGKDR